MANATNTAIIGSGFIERAWEISFARAGSPVKLWDHVPGAAAAAIGYIAGVLGDMEQNDLLNGQTPTTVFGAHFCGAHCGRGGSVGGRWLCHG